MSSAENKKCCVQPLVNELHMVLKECNDCMGQVSAEVVVVRVQCSTLLNELQSITTNVSETEAGELLQRYAKVILDFTYIKENQLTEEEFPVHDGYERMQRIMDMLEQPEHIVHQVIGPTACVTTTLGTDIAECIHWRMGALCYMYCHTVWNNKGRLEKCKPQTIKCLESGVVELQTMLSIRKPVSTAREEVVTNSTDTVSLLNHGVFSDTHVLALMYAGEMCYWHNQLIHQSNASKFTSNQSNTSCDSTQPTNQSDSAIISSPSQSGDGKHEAQSSSQSNTSGNGQSGTSSHVIGTELSSEAEGAACSSQKLDAEEQTFDSRKLGVQFLQRYVEVVKGPLKTSGWDSSNAEDMIKQLTK